MRTAKRRGLACIGSALFLHLAGASAAGLHVLVIDQAGAPVQDAVISATPLTAVKPLAAKPTTAVIDQIKRRFVPLVSVVQTGTAITFPNKDNIEHDVYSFSPAKRFELHMYHGIPARPVIFDKPGLVVMGCNIHDQMIAYLLVVDTPWFAKTDARGAALIDNVPAGQYRLTAWHYRMKDPNAHPSRDVASGSDGPVKLLLQLNSE